MDILFALILLFAFVYSLFILFIRRFHSHNNVFILNMCFAIIGFCIYFTIYFTMVYFDYRLVYAPNTCIILFYTYNIASIGVQFSFLAFSIHRFWSIVYNTIPFVKTKRWVSICIGSQWIAQCVLSLPFVLRKEQVSIYLSFSY